MKTIAVVQARLGSSRLPGKVLFPLDGVPVLGRILRRISPSETLDEIVVATTDAKCEDVIADLTHQIGASSFRGDEQDVLGRLYEAARTFDADTIVRVNADSPFVSQRLVDLCLHELEDGGHDYASTKLERTFPIGYGVETFTMDSFERVEQVSTSPHEREHVTVRYRKSSDRYDRTNITSDQVFEDEQFQNRSDLRLTLDEPADYRLIQKVFTNVENREPTIEEVIQYIDDNNLQHINENVKQKSIYTSESER